MVNALHLLWVIPLSVVSGMLLSVLFSVNSIEELVSEVFAKGYSMGVKHHKELLNGEGRTFREFYATHPGLLYFLAEDTTLIILKEHSDGQLEFVPYNCVDELTCYANYQIVEVKETPKDITIIIKE